MKLSIRQITIAGVLGSITIALGFIPYAGFIPVPTPAGAATTMHIPAILAGILEGPVVGGIVGAIFGGFSFWQAQGSANPIAKMMFTNPAIAFFPRIAIGVVSYYIFRLTRGKKGFYILSVIVGLILGHTGYYAMGAKAQLVRWAFAVLLFILGVILVLAVNRKNPNPGPATGAVAGSLINTIGVLGLSTAFGYIPLAAAVAVGVMHGIPEAMVAVVLTDLIYRSVSRFIRAE